jgi:hypothetical protein
MRCTYRALSTTALLATFAAASAPLAQPRALVAYDGFSALGTPAANQTNSAGWTFQVKETVTVEALGALFPVAPLVALADQQVGLFASGSTTPLHSAVATPTAAIVRPSPSGDQDYEYRYVAVTPFQLLAGSTYTLFSAPVAGTVGATYTYREFVRDLVLDPRLTWIELARGFDVPDDANDGVAYDTYEPFVLGPNSFGAAAGPDFLIAPTAVPEPSTVVLLATGLLAVAGAARRGRRPRPFRNTDHTD